MPSQNKDQQIKNQQDRIDEQNFQIQGMQNQIDSLNFDMPILKIAEEILMVPLIGTIDSVKSQKILESILFSIKELESKVIVIDIAGITVVDSSVAAHLIKIAKATKLMGCKSIVSGISPNIAQNIVNLGVDTSDIETTNTLKDSMVKAYNYIGFELVKKN